MQYYSAIKKKKNEFETVLMGWMKLQPVLVRKRKTYVVY